MTANHIDTPSHSENIEGFEAYLRRVDAQLARLTCGLLTWADFDYDWSQAWSVARPARQAVEQALLADGFVLAKLPTAYMQRLAAKSSSSKNRLSFWQRLWPLKQIKAQLQQRPAIGRELKTASQVDPTKTIKARYRLYELAEVVTSHTVTGGLNPAYDQSWQPRRRSRTADRRQIDAIARQLAPEALLKTGANWAEGPPIVGPDRLVESGNGRVLALRRSLELNPAGYAAYCQALTKRARQYGLKPKAVRRLRQPLLVRERVTPLTAEERLRFVMAANASGANRLGAAEQALAEARLIPAGFFGELQVADSDRSLAVVLSKKVNVPVVARWVNLLPPTERTALLDGQGGLSATGINRLERAMLAYVLPDGERVVQLFFEAGEVIDRIGAGLKQALPRLGQQEALIRASQRQAGLSLSQNLVVVIEKLWQLRQQGLSVTDYLRHYTLTPELTPLQAQLLAQLDRRRRSARAVADLLKAYAGLVLQTTSPDQPELFDGLAEISAERLLKMAVKTAGGVWLELPSLDRMDQPGLDGQPGPKPAQKTEPCHTFETAFRRQLEA
jgi:hypothetical protein